MVEIQVLTSSTSFRVDRPRQAVQIILVALFTLAGIVLFADRRSRAKTRE
jgi:hypothetical protein